MFELTFFSTERELASLTGLDHDKMWETGFNLDDWDWGIRIKSSDYRKLKNRWRWLLTWMENTNCGYESNSFNGYTYIMQYHA